MLKTLGLKMTETDKNTTMKILNNNEGIKLKQM